MSQLRSKEERKRETNEIIKSMSSLKLNTGYSEVTELYKYIQLYINDGIEQKINIKFPSINRIIKGVLPLDKKKKVWVKLEYFDFDKYNVNDVNVNVNVDDKDN